MISLLYNNERKKSPSLSSEAIDSLMLKEALSLVLPEKELRSHFLEILSEPLVETNDILYRQSILKDFLVHRSFLSNLNILFEQFVSVVLEYNKTRQNNKQTFRKTVGSAIDTNASSLQSVANLITSLLTLIKKLNAQFDGLILNSEGLGTLRERLHAIAASDGFQKLFLIAKRFDRVATPNLRADITFRLNKNSQLTEIGYLNSSEETSLYKNKKEQKKRRFFCSGENIQESENAPDSIPLNYNSFTTEKIVGQSISDITDALIDVANHILSEFVGLRDDLMFYEAACRISDKFRELSVNAEFPIFENKTEIFDLYDLFLLFRAPSETTVIPNDFFLPRESGGMLIRGGNGSGKTVYLRSITTAYLFAQSGLPVPAKKACFVPVRHLDILMASSEKTLELLSDAGRFEEEVGKIAEIVNHLEPQSIVMLNEIFQTTAYTEGAEGLYYILRYLSSCSVRWICVTHLLDLFDLFADNDNIIKIEIKNHRAEKFLSPK